MYAHASKTENGHTSASNHNSLFIQPSAIQENAEPTFFGHQKVEPSPNEGKFFVSSAAQNISQTSANVQRQVADATTNTDCNDFQEAIEAAENMAREWVSDAIGWFEEYRELIRNRARRSENRLLIIGRDIYERFQLLDQHFNISSELGLNSPTSAHSRYDTEGFMRLYNVTAFIRRRYHGVNITSKAYNCDNGPCPTGEQGAETLGEAQAGSQEYTLFTSCWNSQSEPTKAGVLLHECFHAAFTNFNHDTYSFESNYPGDNPQTNAESYAIFAALASTGSTYRIIELEGSTISVE
jgi:hypothetical protein